jgi:hypothetical protein
MADTTAPKLETRKGGCHCGAYAYELEAPEIKVVFECNCSICSRKAYLWHFVDENNKFTVVKGDDSTLKEYTFGAGNYKHKFCPTCGTPIMAYNPSNPPGKTTAINVHSIENIDSWSLDKKAFNGAAVGTPFEPPAHKGPLPEVQDGEQVYTGSCHCGAVTMAVASKPLDETYSSRVTECNCSICERNGYAWIYPTREQVVLSGDEANIGEYAFQHKVGAKTFCKTCGVNMTNRMRKFSDEELGALPEEIRGFIEGAWKMHPVNARALHGVDVKKLKVGRSEGRKF